MITLEVNGTEYTNFLSAHASYSVTDFARAFDFSATSDGGPFPIKAGSPVRVLADGVAVCTGFIDSLRIKYDDSSHTVSVRGRSRTADLLDSSITELDLNGPISLTGIIKRVLSNLGINNVKVLGEEVSYKITVPPEFQGSSFGVETTVPVLSDIGLFEKVDPISGGTSQSAFDFIEKYARLRQVLLTTDGDGNIVIARNSEINTSISLINDPNDKENTTVKSGGAIIDHSDRYNKYIVKGQANVSALNNNPGASTSPDDIVDKTGEVTDDEIRAGRVKVLKAEDPSDTSILGDRAEWEKNVRRAKSIVYLPTMEGHSVNGVPWGVNGLVSVRDVYCDIDDQMLIDTVAMSYDDKKGSETHLSCVGKDSYTFGEAVVAPPVAAEYQFGPGAIEDGSGLT